MAYFMLSVDLQQVQQSSIEMYFPFGQATFYKVSDFVPEQAVDSDS